MQGVTLNARGYDIFSARCFRSLCRLYVLHLFRWRIFWCQGGGYRRPEFLGRVDFAFAVTFSRIQRSVAFPAVQRPGRRNLDINNLYPDAAFSKI